MTHMEKVIKHIRDLREDHDYTQAYIARYLETTQHQVSKYERGVQELPVRNLIKLAMLYNVSLDYIAGFTNDERPLFNDHCQ